MSDGRRDAGPLQDILRQHLALHTDFDLIDAVLNRWHGARTEIAALSHIVSHAADHGDETSLDRLTDAGRELSVLVDTTRQRLDWAVDETVPVSSSGGTFASATSSTPSAGT